MARGRSMLKPMGVLGIRMRHRRADLGLTQEQFAATFNLSRTQVAMIERGHRGNGSEFRSDVLRNLAKALDMSVDDLLNAIESAQESASRPNGATIASGKTSTTTS